MTKSFDSSKMLGSTESTSADQESISLLSTPRPHFLKRFLWLVVRLFFVLALLGILIVGGLYYFVSSGPISNEQVRGQVEQQISDLLGADYSAQIDKAQIAVGKGGLIALDARNIKILGKEHLNLGVAGQLSVAMRAVPFLKGDVVAEKISVANASVSLASILPVKSDDAVAAVKPAGWTRELDLKQKLIQVRQLFEQIALEVEKAGLDEFSVKNTKIVGFDELGLRSKSARIQSLKIEKDLRFQKGLFLEGMIETDLANWEVEGEWLHTDAGGKILNLEISGISLKEFFEVSDDLDFYATNSVSASISVPYTSQGAAEASKIAIALSEGKFKLGEHYKSRLIGAELNLRLLPEKNQIELDASPVIFPDARATLTGGVRFPLVGSNGSELPIFEFIANDIRSVALDRRQAEIAASLHISGNVRTNERELRAEKIALVTESGSISGDGSLGFRGETPSLVLDLKMPKMSVASFKQLWPAPIAYKARLWARDGVINGTIKNAWVKANIPAGILGRIDEGAKLKKDHLVASIPIFDAQVKSFGKIPKLTNVNGTIEHRGMFTTVSLDKASLPIPRRKSVALANGTMSFGDFEEKPISVKTSMVLSGEASSIAKLGTYRPFTFTSAIGVSAKNLSGRVSGSFKASFDLQNAAQISNLKWGGKVKLSNVGSKAPIQGRKLSKANLDISLTPSTAKINGVAHVDNVPATLAMVEYFGSSKKKSRRSVTLTLSDEERTELGFDTSAFLSGPVDVTITTNPNGSQHFDVDLKKAKIDLSWIHWRKGKGIRSTASFDLSQKGKTTKLRNFVLRGKGFGAKGELLLDKEGVVSANLKQVKLNKFDDFDVTTKRTRGGLDIAVNARSYDGRALIKSLLENRADDATATNKQKVIVRGSVKKMYGFGNQILTGVTIDYAQSKGKILRANVSALAAGGAPTSFKMTPKNNAMDTRLSSTNAGSILQFLDIYSKVRGGVIKVHLVSKDQANYGGTVAASDFLLLNEPRLGRLLQEPTKVKSSGGEQDIIQKAGQTKIDPNRVRVKRATSEVTMGKKYLKLYRGRLRGGDASAAFDGVVYDSQNRINLKGTYLPGYGFNKFVSKIPLGKLFFGDGRKRGLIGVTFKLTGSYKNPTLIVNPISIIAPGVFKKIFEF